MYPAQLPSAFLKKAEELRTHFGAEAQAKGIEWCTEQLELALQEQGERLLGLQEAAEVSGYSADHLGRLVRDGKIPNAGRKGAPKIRLEDVPRKATNGVPEVATEPVVGQIGNAQIVQSIIESGG